MQRGSGAAVVEGGGHGVDIGQGLVCCGGPIRPRAARQRRHLHLHGWARDLLLTYVDARPSQPCPALHYETSTGERAAEDTPDSP
jgi:hypothetical protein